MYVIDDKNCCLVELLQFFINKIDKNVISLFNQYFRDVFMDVDKWFFVKFFVKCILVNFFKEICIVVGVKKNYILYCLRVIFIIYFNDSGFEVCYIMFMSNYKNESFFCFYNRLVFLNQKKFLSSILLSMVFVFCFDENKVLMFIFGLFNVEIFCQVFREVDLILNVVNIVN